MDLPTEPSECAFDIERKDICLPDSIVSKLSKLVHKGESSKHESKQQIIDDIKGMFECESESCILSQPEVKQYLGDAIESIIDKYFKPAGPRDSDEWLSNENIDSVLDQISRKHPDFLHIPFQMSDFMTQKKQHNLANIDLAKKYKQREMRTFGVVINTDVSSGRGKHWFAIFGDFRTTPATIEYFNSAGDPPLPQIRAWIDLTRHRLEKELAIPIAVVQNKIQHQFDSHSCGPYSLYYIISRQEGIPYEVFHSNVIPDSVMHEFRRHLFRSGK